MEGREQQRGRAIEQSQRASYAPGDCGAVHTPMGPQVRIVLFFMSFIALPEYLTMLWMVKAGRPMEAMLWKTALCAMTAL